MAAKASSCSAQKILIAPLNVASSLPPEIEGSSKIVLDSLVEYLEDRGKTVAKLRFRAGRESWVQATRRVNEAEKAKTFENAASAYAELLSEQIEFDLLIVPTLYVQNAVAKNMKGRWDSTKERIDTKGNPAEYLVKSFLSGATVKAASIMASVYNARGEEIQNKKFGIELIEHVAIRKSKPGASDIWFDANRPPIDDPKRIDRALREVLSPVIAEVPNPEQAAPLTPVTE